MGKVLVKILRGPHIIINLVTSPRSPWFDHASSTVKEYLCHLLSYPQPLSPSHTDILWMCSFCYLP